MSESTKLQPIHLQRAAIVYVRQSSAAQVENNRECRRRLNSDQGCRLNFDQAL